MTQRNDTIIFRTGKWSRLAMAAVLGWTTVVYPVFAQTTPSADTSQPSAPAASDPKQSQAGADQAAQGYSLTDLEYLLGPIALYPDPLLALILPASAFHDEIVEAERWLTSNPQAAERGDFAKVDTKPWDSSVQALTRFPDVIKMLSEHLDWADSLGWAFSVQPTDVATVIQMLRAKAETLGNLKSTQEQVVTTREEAGSRVIYIAPANPERVYVPVYDSLAVFDSALTGALVFSTGVLVGSAWNSRWGWNNRNWNQVWVGRPGGWRAPPGRPGGRPPGAWRPDRPGVRPERPNVRPDRRPGTRPDRPGTRPDRPGARPDRPGVRPIRPDRPSARPDRPIVRPDRPTARPDRPTARPDRPSARPDSRPTRPQAGNRRPGSSRPGNVQRPQGTRPQQRARPQQGARPQQQRARPQQQRARPQQGTRPQQRARPQQRGRAN